ncbi:MAG: metallophosphoesterase family protein [Kiritimatiellae bacterium]|nr:metallophosphoesterase family protein [Kiritimatiellia bacterium]
MKYAIMSDVHANPEALETALADARAAGCGRFLMLGDVTGYGYDPKGALEISRRSFDAVLLGNHDSACVGLEPEWVVASNGNYDLDRKAREELSEEDREWLRGRDLLHEEVGFACVHGDFTRPRSWNYIGTCEEAVQNFHSRTESLMFCGHTHEAAIWEMTEKGVVRAKLGKRLARPAEKAESVSFKLNPLRRYIVNVGSVGYPRHDLCASYGIFDDESGRMTLRRLPFDFESYITEMVARNIELPLWLCRILMAAMGGRR